MTEDFNIVRDGWLVGETDDVEARTTTRLKVNVLGEAITRNLSKRGGGESQAINTSLLPLAEFITKNWWPLLHEPVRPTISDDFRIRHRLDSGMRGYAFPAMAIWSGGDAAIVADWAAFANPFSAISFLTTRPDEPVQLRRDEVETVLMDLIETVLERLGEAPSELSDVWDRVRHSIGDPDEYNYCVAAGRLGLDPYDSETPNLSELAAGLSDSLFIDVSEILQVEELPQASLWLKEAEARLKLFPETDLKGFGEPAIDLIEDAAWVAGQASAEMLRAHTGLSVDDPRGTVSDLLGSIVADGGELDRDGPDGLSGIVQREGSVARIGTVARSARQRRFRACASAYMAWTAMDGEDRAATDALTRRQQASRAFAAEMLAPRPALLARAPRNGFDDDNLLELASDFICPYETVKWQSIRAGIPLRGIIIPPFQRGHVMTEQVESELQ